MVPVGCTSCMTSPLAYQPSKITWRFPQWKAIIDPRDIAEGEPSQSMVCRWHSRLQQWAGSRSSSVHHKINVTLQVDSVPRKPEQNCEQGRTQIKDELNAGVTSTLAIISWPSSSHASRENKKARSFADARVFTFPKTARTRNQQLSSTQ